MYCPNCDLEVATETSRVRDAEEAERVAYYFERNPISEVDGRFDVDEVGEPGRVDGPHEPEPKGTVHMKTHSCANCGEYLYARTYLYLPTQ